MCRRTSPSSQYQWSLKDIMRQGYQEVGWQWRRTGRRGWGGGSRWVGGGGTWLNDMWQVNKVSSSQTFCNVTGEEAELGWYRIRQLRLSTHANSGYSKNIVKSASAIKLLSVKTPHLYFNSSRQRRWRKHLNTTTWRPMTNIFDRWNVPGPLH